MTNVENINDHRAFTCDCGSVDFALLASYSIECNGCGKRQPFEWKELAPYKCTYCGGTGRIKTHHQHGGNELPVLEQCAWCLGTGWIGPDAEKRTTVTKEIK